MPWAPSVSAFRRLSRREIAEEQYLWKCPLCAFGLPTAGEEIVSKHAQALAVAAHRRERHHDVSDVAYRNAGMASSAKLRSEEGGSCCQQACCSGAGPAQGGS